MDGITHDNDEIYENDLEREKFLKNKKIKVFRITDEEVLQRKVDIPLWIQQLIKENY